MLRLFLAWLLLVAAGSKAFDWSRWRYALYSDMRVPWMLASAASIGIPLLEGVAALLLLVAPRDGASLSAGLWSAFACWMTAQSVRGLKADCHCFGVDGERATWLGVVWRFLAAGVSMWFVVSPTSAAQPAEMLGLAALALTGLLAVRAWNARHRLSAVRG